MYNKKVALKNTPAPFFNYILKVNNQLIKDAQDLDIVMPMYNLLFCSKSFRKTTRSFWNYYPDMPKSGYVDEDDERERIFYPIKNSESFNYKTKLNSTLAAGDELDDIKIVMPLKNLSNFMFNLNFLMFNAEIELILKWTHNCVLTEKAARARKEAEVGSPALDLVREINIPTDLKFRITDCKLYVPVVTLQTKYQNQLYKDVETGISIDFKWNKYRSQMIN